jgi:hypothetical protein
MGLSIETVSRCFTQLHQKGLIAFPNTRSVQILRPAELAHLSGD